MKTYVADFETTTIADDCRVWAYAICEVGNEQDVKIGTTIDEFMGWCMDQKDNPKILFHNLKLWIGYLNIILNIQQTQEKEHRQLFTL